MAERGDLLYVYIDDKRITEVPDHGVTWTDTINASIPVAPGDEIYLLSVAYTSGDSSGHDPQWHHECIDLYTDQAMAAEQAKAIRAHYDRAKSSRKNDGMSFDDRHQVTVKLGSGEDYVCHGPWLGYFGRIEEIEVARVHFGPKAVLKF